MSKSILTITPQLGLIRKVGPRGGKGHWFLNDQQTMGVTTATSIIEKPALLGWAAEMGAEFVRTMVGDYVNSGQPVPSGAFEAALSGAKQGYRTVSDKAKARGTKVDEWINAHINARIVARRTKAAFVGQALPDAGENPEAVRSINAFLEWEGSEDVEWLAFQHVAADSASLIVGVSDWWAIIGKGSGRRAWVGDTKSSKGNRIFPEWELQISANLVLAGLAGTLSTVPFLKANDKEQKWWDNLAEIGRADLICDKLTGDYHFGETTTNLRNDWDAVKCAAALRRRIPQTWN